MKKTTELSLSFSKVNQNLLVWSIYDPQVRTDLTSTALKTEKGWWFIDPTFLENAFLQASIQEQPVLGILLTNENHERDSEDLREVYGWKVFAPKTAEAYFKLEIDHFFLDREVLEGGITALSLPGASHGESCFYNANSKALVIGDALIHLKNTGFSFLPDRYCLDPVQAKKSLKLLLDLDFVIMAFAHGDPLLDHPKVRLKELFKKNKNI